MRRLKKELWPYKIPLKETGDPVDIISIEIWLGKQFGTFKERWTVIYRYNGTDFYFKNQHDATLFALKYGS